MEEPQQFSADELALLDKLKDKYEATGQDLKSYLEGLYYTDYLNYWDYIHLDSLLSLQTPRTRYPDEEIFIIYHQISELFFKMIRSEVKQIATRHKLDFAFFSHRLQRINRYVDALVNSFEIMVEGMDREQFMHFRMALLPASGFQSAQIRLIEVASTDFYLLTSQGATIEPSENVENLYEQIYWREGATELATGKQTLTLIKFEQRYKHKIIKTGRAYIESNLRKQYQKLNLSEEEKAQLHDLLRAYDTGLNVNWRLAHYKSAVKYLQRSPENIAATGGTNWQKYLPPRFQKRMFFPELWSEDQKQNWGKAWVERAVGL